MKRSQKPYVQIKTVGGKTRAYYRMTWLQDGKRREKFIPLPSDIDSAEFDRAYWAIRSGTSPALKKPEKDTWADLIRAYRTHPKFTRLATSTKRAYDRILNEIAEKNADKPVRSLTRAQVRAIHAKYVDTPRRADWMVQIISLLLNFARQTLDWKVENVAEGIELYGKQREFEPWPDWMISKLDTAPANVRAVAELILGTGQRPNAAINMRHDDFHGEWMDVLDEKTDTRIEVYSPPSLRAFLASQPKRGAHILAKNLTEPLGYSAVEKAFRAWRASLGEKARPFTLHGLRKLAIIRLAEAGCTDAQIQSITNQTPEMIAYYRARASRKRLSKAAITLVERNKSET
ncbi:phage integrase family protein [Rhodobacter sp. JA431]|uniref:tyrosine-type recombinase/integrase n=1 Tax=Rhodobacter sp. JA431 TaxID=570013 RepID=UPI000BC4A0AD|nr:tyrosine-type recombinase/integrase [Rhodobacter sp. JA431]SOC13881.1 phage integrase family protein [Rhodobacter sp. JA431]